MFILDKFVIICVGENKFFECFFFGLSIVIEEVFWGCLLFEICFLEDGDLVINCFSDLMIIFIVRSLCDDKEYCEIFVWYNVL